MIKLAHLETFAARMSRRQIFLFSLLIGTLHVWTLGRGLNPLNLTWLHGDMMQYQAGFEFLRHQKTWQFPPTFVRDLGYPLGTSIAYMDSIPSVAIAASLFSRILPENFQYLGLFAALCHALQFFFGFLLVSRFTSDRRIAFLGALLFMMSPPLLFRLHGHFALMSHWVILASFYLYFRPVSAVAEWRHVMWPHLALAAVAASINPYIALFAVAGAGADLLQRVLRRSISVPLAVAGLASIIAAVLASLALFGFLSSAGTQLAGGGYTFYSMNLLSPFDPWGYRSILLPPLKNFAGQSEGYNYLGLGTLLLLCVLPVAAYRSRAALRWQVILPLALLALAFTALAVSTKVTIGESVLYNLEISNDIQNILAAFRASGRLFWLVYYLIMLAGIIGLIVVVKRPALRIVILTVVIGIQFADTLSLRKSIAAARSQHYPSPLLAKDWQEMAKSHRHLLVYPAWQCGPEQTPGGPDGWYWFAVLAARNGMTINEYYTSRFSSEALDLYCRKQPEETFRNGPSPDTAVVLKIADVLNLVRLPGNRHYCRSIDGFGLCTFDPGLAARSLDSMRSALQAVSFDDEITPVAGDRRLLETGFSGWEGAERWTSGREANIWFNAVRPPDAPLKLTLQFNRALLSDRHPLQRVEIALNGVDLGTAELRHGTPQTVWEFPVPQGVVLADKITNLQLRLPDAVTPQAIGINADTRELAVGLRSFRMSRP